MGDLWGLLDAHLAPGSMMNLSQGNQVESKETKTDDHLCRDVHMHKQTHTHTWCKFLSGCRQMAPNLRYDVHVSTIIEKVVHKLGLEKY